MTVWAWLMYFVTLLPPVFEGLLPPPIYSEKNATPAFRGTPCALSSNRQQVPATHCNIFHQRRWNTVIQIWSDDKSHRVERRLHWCGKCKISIILRGLSLAMHYRFLLLLPWCFLTIEKKRSGYYCCLLSLQHHFQQNWSLIQMLIELKFVSIWDMTGSLHEFICLSFLILFILPFPRD